MSFGEARYDESAPLGSLRRPHIISIPRSDALLIELHKDLATGRYRGTHIELDLSRPETLIRVLNPLDYSSLPFSLKKNRPENWLTLLAEAIKQGSATLRINASGLKFEAGKRRDRPQYDHATQDSSALPHGGAGRAEEPVQTTPAATAAPSQTVITEAHLECQRLLKEENKDELEAFKKEHGITSIDSIIEGKMAEDELYKATLSTVEAINAYEARKNREYAALRERLEKEHAQEVEAKLVTLIREGKYSQRDRVEELQESGIHEIFSPAQLAASKQRMANLFSPAVADDTAQTALFSPAARVSGEAAASGGAAAASGGAAAGTPKPQSALFLDEQDFESLLAVLSQLERPDQSGRLLKQAPAPLILCLDFSNSNLSSVQVRWLLSCIQANFIRLSGNALLLKPDDFTGGRAEKALVRGALVFELPEEAQIPDRQMWPIAPIDSRKTGTLKTSSRSVAQSVAIGATVENPYKQVMVIYIDPRETYEAAQIGQFSYINRGHRLDSNLPVFGFPDPTLTELRHQIANMLGRTLDEVTAQEHKARIAECKELARRLRNQEKSLNPQTAPDHHVEVIRYYARTGRLLEPQPTADIKEYVKASLEAERLAANARYKEYVAKEKLRLSKFLEGVDQKISAERKKNTPWTTIIRELELDKLPEKTRDAILKKVKTEQAIETFNTAVRSGMTYAEAKAQYPQAHDNLPNDYKYAISLEISKTAPASASARAASGSRTSSRHGSSVAEAGGAAAAISPPRPQAPIVPATPASVTAPQTAAPASNFAAQLAAAAARRNVPVVAPNGATATAISVAQQPPAAAAPAPFAAQIASAAAKRQQPKPAPSGTVGQLSTTAVPAAPRTPPPAARREEPTSAKTPLLADYEGADGYQARAARADRGSMAPRALSFAVDGGAAAPTTGAPKAAETRQKLNLEKDPRTCPPPGCTDPYTGEWSICGLRTGICLPTEAERKKMLPKKQASNGLAK